MGMNATRAASIRLRAAFDGAVSLGRVQTPTLALLVKREQAIRDFKPEPYWLVEAKFSADESRRYAGRYLGGKRIAEDEAAKIVREVEGQQGEITKLEKKEERELPQLLYDLTTLQRHANTLHGFSARRTLAAAQRLYEEHKAITYPRTNSRYLSGDLVAEIKPTAELVGHNQQTRRSPTTTPSSPRAPSTTSRRWEGTSSRSTTWWPSASWPCSTRRPSSSAPGSRPPWPRMPSAPAAACCWWRAGRRCTARRSTAASQPRTTRAATSCCRSSSRASWCRPTSSSRCARRRSRRGASPTPRCSARWRRRARTSRTWSCARR